MSTQPPALEIDLADEDIRDAMQQMQAYVDVFTDDFRTLYRLAHAHAIQRLTAGLTAASLMRRETPGLSASMTLAAAAQVIVQSGYKGLAVVDESGRVTGMLTETDYLRRFEARTFLELLLRMAADSAPLTHRCHQSLVSEAMTWAVVSVPAEAGFGDIFRAFREHAGRSMPVVDSDQRLQGLLLRKDFLSASHLERLM